MRPHPSRIGRFIDRKEDEGGLRNLAQDIGLALGQFQVGQFS